MYHKNVHKMGGGGSNKHLLAALAARFVPSEVN